MPFDDFQSIELEKSTLVESREEMIGKSSNLWSNSSTWAERKEDSNKTI